MDKVEIQIIHQNETIGELNDLPFGNSRSSIVSTMRTILERVMGTPYEMHLKGRSGYNRTGGVNNIIDIVSDGKYLYTLNTAGIAGSVTRIDMKTFTISDTLSITATAPSRMVIAGGGDGENYLYIIGFDVPSILSKVRLSDFTEVATITLNTGSGWAITTNGTHLFIAHAARYVTRVSIETFLEVDVLDLGVGIGSFWAAICSGTYLYVSVLVSPGKLVKIDTNSFTLVNTLTFAAGLNNPTSLTINGNHIYVGFNIIANPGIVAKVSEISFTTTKTLTLPAGMEGVMALTCDAGSIYCGIDLAPGQIAIIDIASFQYRDYILLTGNQPRCIHNDETFLYSGFLASPGTERTYIIPSASADSKRMDTILEQVHTGKYYMYPSNAAPASVTSGAGAYTKGNYTEVIPANTITSAFYITGMYINLQTAGVDYELDIAIGTAGSEVIIATESASYSSTNRSFDMAFPIPIQINAASRVAVRCSDAVGSKIALVKIRCKD